MGTKITVWILQKINQRNCTRDNKNIGKEREREIESRLIATQNNTIRTNYVKVKIYNMQKNSNYRLCVDRDETVNHIIMESSKS